MLSKLKAKLKTLPKAPGVYLFKDAQGEVLYVGKAKNLRNRVRSYFPPHPWSLSRPPAGEAGKGRGEKEVIMLAEASDLDYVVVSSETESLILENNLIKQYRPRFNVRLRDDKNYQFIKIDYTTEIPQVYPVRRPSPSPLPLRRRQGFGGQAGERDKRNYVKHFGPYTSALSVKRTLKLIKSVFHLCQNKKVSNRPCFAYFLKRCPGVCIGKVSLAEYRKTLSQVEEFLKYKQGAVVRELKAQMKQAAQNQRFEKAAALRDRLRALQSIWERQKIVSAKKENQDFLGLFANQTEAFIVLFLVRDGKLIHKEEFELAHEGGSKEEILERFILQYYQDASSLPKEIFVPAALPAAPRLEKGLKGIKGVRGERNVKVKIRYPRRGKKAQLLGLASQNARLAYERSFAAFEKSPQQALQDLTQILNLPKTPERIEAYDISNIQGFAPVGSMVVFLGGEPDKSQYRKFKIKPRTVSAEAPTQVGAKADDVAMMKEMIKRRFRHINSNVTLERSDRVSKDSIVPPMAGLQNDDDEQWIMPDLIIVDGGKGQLNAALAVLTAYNLQIPTVGLAKRLEEIYLPSKKTPIRLPQDSPALQLLQRIRDEAHRFAITFYRKKHRQALLASGLDAIPGIGPKTKKQLLLKFGTLAAIRSASLEALAKEIGMAKAKKIKENL